MSLDPIWVLEGVIGLVLYIMILRVEHGHFRKRTRKTKTWRTKGK
jgi:hypothetical protein